MFSSTTMELSITMPTAKLIPARLITLIVLPNKAITINVPMMLIGIAVATTIVLLELLRNSKSTAIASIPPIMRFCLTRSIAPTI